MNADAGGYLFYAGRYDEAVRSVRKTIDLDPSFAPSYRQLGGILEQMGRFEEAIEAFEKAKEVSGSATYSLTALAHTYALSGRRADAMKMLAQLEDLAKRKYVSPYSLAAVHVALGDFDRAFAYLDRAVKAHDRALIWIRVAPRFNAIRSDPRLGAILRTVGAA
jgi:tetratricopeptide (TPR) repeat protein